MGQVSLFFNEVFGGREKDLSLPCSRSPCRFKNTVSALSYTFKNTPHFRTMDGLEGEEELDFETPFSMVNAWVVIEAYFEEHGLVRQQ